MLDAIIFDKVKSNNINDNGTVKLAEGMIMLSTIKMVPIWHQQVFQDGISCLVRRWFQFHWL